MMITRNSRRSRRRFRKGNRLLRRYRLKTNTLVKKMVPLQQDMSPQEIATFIENLKTIAVITPNK